MEQKEKKNMRESNPKLLRNAHVVTIAFASKHLNLSSQLETGFPVWKVSRRRIPENRGLECRKPNDAKNQSAVSLNRFKLISENHRNFEISVGNTEDSLVLLPALIKQHAC